jgi:acyl-CoA thioesterase-2
VLDLWTDLLGCLDLHLEHDQSEADNVTVFEGVSQQLDYHRVFGGQLLGQFIRAASPACPDKTVKSLHAVFAREGRAAEPVRRSTANSRPHWPPTPPTSRSSGQPCVGAGR